MPDAEEIAEKAERAAGQALEIYKKQSAGLSDEEKNQLLLMAYIKFMEKIAEWNEPIDVMDDRG